MFLGLVKKCQKMFAAPQTTKKKKRKTPHKKIMQKAAKHPQNPQTPANPETLVF